MSKISAAEAQSLWGELRKHFANAENVIQEIVEQKAWEPLGYGSFAEAWVGEMSTLTLPSEVRPHVVYQMLAEGWEPVDIAEAVKGVGRGLPKDLPGNAATEYRRITRLSASTIGGDRHRLRTSESMSAQRCWLSIAELR